MDSSIGKKMAKCKKGKIWDTKIKKCRAPNKDEKITMTKYKTDVKTSKEFGAMAGAGTGMSIGTAIGSKVSKKAAGVGGIIGTVIGGAYGSYKGKKHVDKQYKKAGIKVPSRKKRKK